MEVNKINLARGERPDYVIIDDLEEDLVINLFSAQGNVEVCSGCDTASNTIYRGISKPCCPDNSYKVCRHEKGELRVLSTSVTCELTAVFCSICKTQLTNLEQDCK